MTAFTVFISWRHKCTVLYPHCSSRSLPHHYLTSKLPLLNELTPALTTLISPPPQDIHPKFTARHTAGIQSSCTNSLIWAVTSYENQGVALWAWVSDGKTALYVGAMVTVIILLPCILALRFAQRCNLRRQLRLCTLTDDFLSFILGAFWILWQCVFLRGLFSDGARPARAL